MIKLTERVQRIKPSPTLKIDSLAKAMQAEGKDVVGFGAGEPDFDTPDFIKQAAIDALKAGKTKYTPVGGINELKDAIIAKFKRDNNLAYVRDEIIVSCGGKHALYNIAQVLFEAGDEVIIPSPYWVSYPDQILINDAIPVFICRLFLVSLVALTQPCGLVPETVNELVTVGETTALPP